MNAVDGPVVLVTKPLHAFEAEKGKGTMLLTLKLRTGHWEKTAHGQEARGQAGVTGHRGAPDMGKARPRVSGCCGHGCEALPCAHRPSPRSMVCPAGLRLQKGFTWPFLGRHGQERPSLRPHSPVGQAGSRRPHSALTLVEGWRLVLLAHAQHPDAEERGGSIPHVGIASA